MAKMVLSSVDSGGLNPPAEQTVSQLEPALSGAAEAPGKVLDATTDGAHGLSPDGNDNSVYTFNEMAKLIRTPAPAEPPVEP